MLLNSLGTKSKNLTGTSFFGDKGIPLLPIVTDKSYSIRGSTAFKMINHYNIDQWLLFLYKPV